MNEIQSTVAAQIAELGHLPMADLWAMWDRFFERRPDRPNRTHIELRLAYKLQEQAFGGLAPETRQRLEAIGAKHSKIKLRVKPRAFNFAPGTVLLREWDDREHRVTVNAEGRFEYEGSSFTSLTAVARHITGAHWSGPLFRPAEEGRRVMAEIASTKPRKRCAVYCRVSSDERLDQEFNSIDAQKEAGHAFIASQRSEGWIPVDDDYDDPGFSGGNTDRPALKRLMADIQGGRVDIVVVYKIDRLTRSLPDFSKMVEVFERQQVFFVSVTQQFNTTTSMGRLTLNILLSFAQFEREVTGERIRDKIAAAKKKGMWMGGVPTIGYDVVNRLLVINKDEAAVVRRMFEEMLTIGSPTQIATRLTEEGITTKAWTTQDGRVRIGTRIDKKYIHKVLRNRIYLGELSNRGNWYPGAHEPIIPRELWDKAHEVLARDSHARGVDTKIRSRNDALLRGLLYAPSGERMYPTYSRKNGRKYQYYVSKSEARFGAPGKSYERLPAAEIEVAVVAQIRTVLTSPESIASVVRDIQKTGARIDEATTVMAMGRLNDVWAQLFPVEQHRIANLMIERIDLIHTDELQGIKVKWRELGWDELIGEFVPRGVGAELLEVEA